MEAECRAPVLANEDDGACRHDAGEESVEIAGMVDKAVFERRLGGMAHAN